MFLYKTFNPVWIQDFQVLSGVLCGKFNNSIVTLCLCTAELHFMVSAQFGYLSLLMKTN